MGKAPGGDHTSVNAARRSACATIAVEMFVIDHVEKTVRERAGVSLVREVRIVGDAA